MLIERFAGVLQYNEVSRFLGWNTAIRWQVVFAGELQNSREVLPPSPRLKRGDVVRMTSASNKF